MDQYIQIFKYLIKNLIAYSLYYSGFLLLAKNSKFNGKNIVLTYHRVLPDNERSKSFSNQGIIVSPESFETQLKFLTKHFDILSIDELHQRLSDPSSPHRPGCLITFDDGWLDNYNHALPILRRHKAPATVFIPVDYIGTGKLFWQEATARSIYDLLKHAAEKSSDLFKKHDLQLLLESLPADEAELKTLILKQVNSLKSRPYTEINSLNNDINEILKNLNQDSVDAYIDWNKVIEMSQSNITFASHACSHNILTRLDREQVESELTKSKQLITSKIGMSHPYIAYPNGDSDEMVQEIAYKSGYKMGFGTRPGLISRGDNMFDLQRINIHENKAKNSPLFMMSLLGYF